MSQKQSTIPKRKEEQTTMYKLNYKEHITLKQAAYQIMQHYNNKEYNSDKPNKQFIKYNQTLYLLYKKPKEELLDIIDRYLTSQEKLNNQKLLELNTSQIKVPRLKNLTDKEVQQIADKLQQLELKYILQLDTNYSDKQSILLSYQQLLAYKHYNIPIQLRPEETEEELYGNTDIIDQQYYEYYHPYNLEDVLDEETIEQYTIERSA